MAHVGCSGWMYKHWRGNFYPSGIPQKEWFNHYASVFDTVELNNPFYGWPQEHVLKQWYQKAPEGFIYTFKVNQNITHRKRFKETEEITRDFYKIAKTMKEKMGCFLFQLPPSYVYSEENLKNILGNLNPKHRNVVEFRHRSWWDEKVYNALAEADATFVSVSAPELPDDIINTNGRVYLRLHGVKQWYKHDYSENELQDFAERIKQVRPKETWVYFDNDTYGNAPRNAQRMREILRVTQGEPGEQREQAAA